MSKIKFYSMRLNVKELKDVINDTGFDGLVFQPIIENADKKIEFMLVCYELYNLTYRMSKIPFVIYNKKPWDAEKKIMYGNLPMPKVAIETIIKNLPDDAYLYLYPGDYDDYVKYTVTKDPDYTGNQLNGYELKPSPPAIPPDVLSASPK